MLSANQLRMLQTEAGPVSLPPNDLPSDEPPLESYLHLQQMILLLNCLDWLWRNRQDYFAAGNLS
jgi:Uma2 family endonuclease